MTHIVKITQDGDKWKIEDWKQRWVQIAYAADIKNGTPGSVATTYGNTYPFSLEWNWLQAIAENRTNYYHAEWLGTEWNVCSGRVHEPKRQW
jgi:hypothetical protein